MAFGEYAGVAVGLFVVAIGAIRAAVDFVRYSNRQQFYRHNRLGELEIFDQGVGKIVVNVRDASQQNIEKLDRAIEVVEEKARQQRTLKNREGLSKEKTAA